MRLAVCACSTPRVVANPPLVERNPVLRRGHPADSGGLLKATTSAKSNRSDQALLRNATLVRDGGDDIDADLLQVAPAQLLCRSWKASAHLLSHHNCHLTYDRCI